MESVRLLKMAEWGVPARRLIPIIAVFCVLCLAVPVTRTEAQLIPIAQTRFVISYGCPSNSQASATDFSPFNASVNADYDTCGAVYGSASASQNSFIQSSLISASGSAGESHYDEGQSYFSVTFNVSNSFQYALTGSLGGGSPANTPVFVTLTGPTGTNYAVQLVWNQTFSTNFSALGVLPPGQYTLTANDTIGGGPDENGSYNLTFSAYPPSVTAPAIAIQSNDVLLTWTTTPGTNVVQATDGAADGSYSNNFLTISPLIIVPLGANLPVATNYLDVGGATNFPARYYRVTLIPGEQIMIAPAALAFGAVAAGATSQQVFVVTNNGTVPVANGSAIVTGGPFSVVSGSPFALAPGGSTNVVVQFAPMVSGAFTDAVIFSTEFGLGSTNTISGNSIIPVAQFSANPTNGTAPLTVTFTDNSTGTITNWFWNFGDGAATNLITAGVSHTYNTSGVYSVSLTVSGPAGTNTSLQANLITVTHALFSDNAADPAYSGGWTNGSNGGSGFNPWTLTASGVIGSSSNGYFIGTSVSNAFMTAPGIDTSGKSWGIYANGTNFTAAYRGFSNSVPVGGAVKLDMDNGFIDAHNADGFVLRNGNVNAGYANYNTNARFELLYIGGDSSNSYKVVDAAGLYNIGVPFTGTGLHLVFTLNTADTYTLLVIDNASGNTNATVNGALGGTSGSTIDSIALYNRNAGTGAANDAFFNSLQIIGP